MPNCFRVELIWQLSAADFAVNVLHYIPDTGDPVDQSIADNIASQIEGAWTSSNVDGQYSTVMGVGRITTRDLRTPGQPVFESAVTMVGDTAQEMVPAQSCIVHTLRSDLNTRRGRGRIFWPATRIGTCTTTGQIQPVTIAAFESFMDLILSLDTGLNTVDLGVLSRVDDTCRLVTAHNVNNVFDVQRRRRDVSIS